VTIIDLVDVFNGEKRESQNAIVKRLARFALRILDLHHINVANLADGRVCVGCVQFDLDHPLESGQIMKAVLCALARRTGLVSGSLAVIPLDHQCSAGVEHVEVADGRCTRRKNVFPVPSCPLSLLDREFEDA